MSSARLPQPSHRRDARLLPDLIEDVAVGVAVLSGVLMAILVLALTVVV